MQVNNAGISGAGIDGDALAASGIGEVIKFCTYDVFFLGLITFHSLKLLFFDHWLFQKLNPVGNIEFNYLIIILMLLLTFELNSTSINETQHVKYLMN